MLSKMINSGNVFFFFFFTDMQPIQLIMPITMLVLLINFVILYIGVPATICTHTHYKIYCPISNCLNN